MSHLFKSARCFWPALWAVLLAMGVVAADPPPKDAPARAPADHVVLQSDRAGAWFVPNDLKEKQDALLESLAVLRTRIDRADLSGDEARREIDRLRSELDSLRQEIDKVKLFVPGANVHTTRIEEAIPLAADDFLLIECSDLEIRGADDGQLRIVLEKTALAEPGREPHDDFAGVKLVHSRVKGTEKFGYYADIRNRPDGKQEWENFAFRDFVDREFLFLTIEGLTHEQGNRQIEIESKNETGAGIIGSDWRRHARLILEVPTCGNVGVIGALGGLKVRGLNAPLTIQGSGDTDYDALYEVADLHGPLIAERIPLHRVSQVAADVRVTATAFPGSGSTSHGGDGVTMRPQTQEPFRYEGIRGDLTVRATRAELHVTSVAGRIDVQNDFGRTVLETARPLAGVDHRLVSESGAIEIRLPPDAVAAAKLALFTECGIVHLAPGMSRGLESKSYETSGSVFMGETDGVSRSWYGFVAAGGEPSAFFETIQRIADAHRGRSRSPGLDVINRAGTITLAPLQPAVE